LNEYNDSDFYSAEELDDNEERLTIVHFLSFLPFLPFFFFFLSFLNSINREIANRIGNS